jgi:hypothetical protein
MMSREDRVFRFADQFWRCKPTSLHSRLPEHKDHIATSQSLLSEAINDWIDSNLQQIITMDFDIASQASAIDDSFFPLAPQSASLKSSNGNDVFVSGPRSGHWTVSSGGNRSAIDDRTPTIHGFPITSEAGSVARTKKVDGATLRKLAVATEAEPEAERKLRQRTQREEAHMAVEEDTKQAKAKLEKPQKFVLPTRQGTSLGLHRP